MLLRVMQVILNILNCRPSGTEDIVRVYAEADTQVNIGDTCILLNC